ncbi:MAG: protein kinase domain-containing protein [Planctomycetota bacterium]|jgi:serine/threonine protein kinase/Flp pilus assembly protein TadD
MRERTPPADSTHSAGPDENGKEKPDSSGPDSPGVTSRLRSTKGIRGDISLEIADLPAGLFSDLEEENRYAILEEIARGGMGAILKLVDKDIRRPVAMKVILGEGDLDSIERFVEEAQVTGQLEHPNIVPVHELGLNHEGRVYFTMKLVKGDALESIVDRLAEKDRATVQDFPLTRLLQVFLKVCEAVAFAHDKGVIHRDLKPDNIMVGNFGEVLVMDWGLAKVLGREETRGSTDVQTDRAEEEDVARTVEGDVMGTPAYMPPEQADGQIDEIDEQSDVFALGGVLYKMLCYEAPHSGETLANVMLKAVEGRVKPPGKRTPSAAVPPELDSICMKALAGKKGERYPSVEALISDVQAYLDHRLVSAHAYTPFARFLRFIQRHPAGSLAGGVALFLGTAGLAIILLLTSWAREEAARAEAEGLRATKAERRAEDAEDALVKGRAVSAVMRAASRELSKEFLSLKQSYYMAATGVKTTGLTPEQSRKVGDFERTVPADSASQAAWFAAKGWLFRLASDYEKADALFDRALETDPDVAYGPLFKAMDRLAKLLLFRHPPSIDSTKRGFRFGKTPPDTPQMVMWRSDIEESLAQVRKAKVLGEYSAKDLEKVLDGIGGFQGDDLIASERGLSKALSVPELAWIHEELLLARAIVRYFRRKFLEGLVDIDRVLEVLPESASGANFKGMMLVGLGFSDLAANRDPEWTWRRALQSFGEALRRMPKGNVFRSGRGNVLKLLGNHKASKGEDPLPAFEEAAEEFSKALELDAKSAVAYSGRGSALRSIAETRESRGEDARDLYRRAISDLSEAVVLRPGYATPMSERGLARSSLGSEEGKRGRDPMAHYRKALKDFTVAIEWAPENALTYMNRGITHAKIGSALFQDRKDSTVEFGKAIDDFTLAIEKDPENESAFSNRSIAYRRLGLAMRQSGGDAEDPMKKAISDATEAIRLNEKSFRALGNRGSARTTLAGLLESRGEDVESLRKLAIEDFEAAVQAHPNHPEGHLNLGTAYTALGETKVKHGQDPRETLGFAVEALKDSIRLNPRNALAHFNLALSYTRIADAQRASRLDPMPHFIEAEKALAECLKINPRFWQGTINHAFILERMGRGEEALKNLEAADRDWEGRNPRIKAAMAKILKRRKK